MIPLRAAFLLFLLLWFYRQLKELKTVQFYFSLTLKSLLGFILD